MGRSLVVLLIGLMEAALHQLSSSFIPEAFSSVKTYTFGTSFPEETYPITEWSVSLWMHTSAGGADVIAVRDPYFILTWYSTTFRLYDGSDSYDVTTLENLPPKWIFYQLGSTATMSYGAATIRSGSQYFISSTITGTLTATDSRVAFFGYCFL
jgi:hypothetical protein